MMKEREFYSIDCYWRAANFLSLARIYLKSSAMLKRELSVSDFKERFVGHWGACPSINFIYAHLNYVIRLYNCKIQLILGTGHGGNALLANLYLEGTLKEYYDFFKDNEEDLDVFLNFESKVRGMRAEVNPCYPGTIYDGGELGYSLSVAYGSVMGNKEAITVCIIGDGEAETGSLAAAWNCYKCMNNNDGHVLPIINLNGFKMGSSSLLSRMTDNELKLLFRGLGFRPKIVKHNHVAMNRALVKAIESFNSHNKGKANPLIILKSPKGWTAPHGGEFEIEGHRNSHKIPIMDVKENTNSYDYIKKWLLSYKPNELFDANGTINCFVKSNIPKKELMMGMMKYKKYNMFFPELNGITVDLANPLVGNISVLNDYLEKLYINNVNGFRIFSPDELESNRLGKLSNNCRVVEILNENICQGWMQGYNLTGRNSILISYEAFMPIISSMVSQYVKYLIQMKEIEWRVVKPSMNYLLTSVCWENTYSHQNPGFINSLIILESDCVNVYYPIDAYTLLTCIDKVLKSEEAVNVITVSKYESRQHLSLNEATVAVNKGYYMWQYGENEIDIVYITIGDICLNEMVKTVQYINNVFPSLRFRMVSIIDFTKFIKRRENKIKEDEILDIFLPEKPRIFIYHGYPSTIYSLDERVVGQKATILGYCNRSIAAGNKLSKMHSNGCSRYEILYETNNILKNEQIISEDDYAINIMTIDKIVK